jgi:hypothetical protein
LWGCRLWRVGFIGRVTKVGGERGKDDAGKGRAGSGMDGCAGGLGKMVMPRGGGCLVQECGSDEEVEHVTIGSGGLGRNSTSSLLECINEMRLDWKL